MAFHTFVNYVSIGTTANTDVPALADGIFTITNNHILPQKNYDLPYAFAMSATLDRARMVTPNFRQITLPFIRPVEASALPVDDPNLADYVDNPLRIIGLEEFSIQATSAVAMGSEDMFAVYAFEDQRRPAPQGDIYTLRGTSSTTGAQRVWTNISVTWADELAAGRYTAVGLNVIATNIVAARLVFEDQVLRPGCVGSVAVGNRTADIFRKGRLGRWGDFTSTALPNVEVLQNATDASYDIYLDIIRVG